MWHSVEKPVVPVSNTTLLKLAAIDIGEAQFQQEIEQLLEGSFGNQGRHRSFLSSGRFNHLDIRSPQSYRLWLDVRRNLHDWSRKKRFQPDISVGLWATSGILLKSEHGQLIDSHEVVIRLNNARTVSFEHDVGSKTSISFVNSNILHLCALRQGCFCHPYGVTVPIVMYVCQGVHLWDYTVCNSSHKAPLLITDPRFDVLCTRIVKYYSLKRFAEVIKKPLEEWDTAHDGSMFHYSSGMQAVMLALGICDKVSIFGFGKSASAKHHYHTNQKAELHLHDYEAEYDFYHDLAERPEAIPFILDKFKIPPVGDPLGSIECTKAQQSSVCFSFVDSARPPSAATSDAPLGCADRQGPLLNLCTVCLRMDSLQLFHSDSVNNNTLIGLRPEIPQRLSRDEVAQYHEAAFLIRICERLLQSKEASKAGWMPPL
ncbi:hypothetical protein F0562_001856 [Nyssa sinensis]|uniref:Uncharacterized protein n=1 Tax=Nyssa sinensis TaxID=561372 RepID=A0A5J5C878_9ASTE|nr:hypothetical protein F0562_001856 [Nyssa sinensis]